MTNLHDQAEVARAMTGSKLNDDELFEQVLNTNPLIKNQSAEEVDVLVKAFNAPFDKAFPNIKISFNLIANKYRLDAASLFWIYMEWLKSKNN